jgi:hypothetical protein
MYEGWNLLEQESSRVHNHYKLSNQPMSRHQE